MKQVIKFTIFLQVLVALVYGCAWIVLNLLGQNCPLVVLPIVMAIVFATELLVIFIVTPLVERWLN